MLPAWRRLRRAARLLRWGAGALPAVGGTGLKSSRRLLLIYDLSSQPFSVGDILVFQVAALALRLDHGLDKVDVCVVYDPQKPVVSDPAFAAITRESFLVHLATILPAAAVNPHLGSLFLFDSHRQLEAHIADNAGAYFVWPSLAQYASREYLFYHCYNELLPAFHAQHGFLPTLRSRPAAATWAKRFLEQHAGTAVPVTIQLRRNPANPARDSNMDAWLGLFRTCADRYAAKFIVVCARSEVDPALRGLPNVTLAKDYCTTLEEDLALIEAGGLHMGASSGPGTMAEFSSKPFCLFNCGLRIDSVRGFVQESHRHRFWFSTRWQSWIFGPETEELLLAEFQRLWTGLQEAAGGRAP